MKMKNIAVFFCGLLLGIVTLLPLWTRPGTALKAKARALVLLLDLPWMGHCQAQSDLLDFNTLARRKQKLCLLATTRLTLADLLLLLSNSCSSQVEEGKKLWRYEHWLFKESCFGLKLCPGFDWGRVNFLHSSWYSAMFWVQYEKNVDYTLMFSVVAQ